MARDPVHTISGAAHTVSDAAAHTAADAAHVVSDASHAVSDASRMVSSASHAVSHAAHDVSDTVAAHLPEEVLHSSFDPTLPRDTADERRWWGRPFGELRWQAELARLLVDPVYRGQGLPRGNGLPVLLIPGFLAGESSLSVMEGWLRRLGYDAYGSGMVFNVDCSDRALDRLERVLLRLHAKTGRPVALIGHSRGGHFAKALARRHPESVAGVVSMGSGLDTPFDVSLPTKAAIAVVRRGLGALDRKVSRSGCLTESCDCPFARDYSAAFPDSVPITSLYTKGDGVVWWEACRVPYARNVEVTGSHVGLAFNRHAYREIAHTLAGLDG